MDERRQCSATSKQSGNRCKRAPIPGGTVCVSHGGKAPQVQAKAAERIASTRDAALAALMKLIESGQVDAKVALDAVVRLTETHETLEGRVARREGRVVDERSDLDRDITDLLAQFDSPTLAEGSVGTSEARQ